MNNWQTRPNNNKFLVAKLSALISKLQNQSDPSSVFKTKEETLSTLLGALSSFYRNITAPVFCPINPVVDTAPSFEDYNQNFSAIYDDLTIIFTEFENLEQLVLGNFNYIVSRLNRLNARIKDASSNLADYILLSDNYTKDAVFFGDSFTGLNRVEFNSPLLNSSQLEIDQEQGIVTLPVDKSLQKSISIKDLPVINSNSNGYAGNNWELNARPNGDISVILDGNADTWFEYERVVATDDGIPLVLDLTINLGQPVIVNHIRINPNNFGTTTAIEVLAVDTSIDGHQFVSIKDDIPLADWTAEDEENIFTLAPATSKYAGQGVYTFTPRKAKYLHLTLRQSTPYSMYTAQGARLRYAIGLRDVHVEARPYMASGELISTNYTLNDEIKKVVLLTNQNPLSSTPSALASINHFVSPDNGISWYELRPKDSSGIANTSQEVPELLDFNGIDPESVVTSSPVYSIRYKAKMQRNTKSFSGDPSELAQQTAYTTELHKPILTTPFTLNLQEKPIEGTVRLVDPNFGSRGKPGEVYDIAVGTGSKLSLRLPWKPFPRLLTKEYSGGKWNLIESGGESLYVNGELWSRGNPLASGATDCVYKINYEDGTIVTGDGLNGKAPPVGSVVSLLMDEEKISVTGNSPHIATLSYPTVTDKKQVEVYLVHQPKPATVLLKKGATIHRLSPNVSSEHTIRFSDTTVFQTLVSFIDGSTELTDAHQYSIDYTNGVLYSRDKTSVSQDTTVHYYYTDNELLAESEWDFSAGSSGVASSIVISDTKWKTESPDAPMVIPSGVRYFNLPQLSIVPGSLVFSDTTTFSREVAFIDGKTELIAAIKVAQQIGAITVTTPGLQTVPLSMQIVSSTDFAVSFSNTDVFDPADEVLTTPDSLGKWRVNRSSNSIQIFLNSSVADAGNIIYYYTNPNASLTGRYSVNYSTGEVYTYGTTGSSTTVDYKYTDYRVRYPVAREIPIEDYTVDILNRKVVIKDREILRSQRIPQVTPLGARDKYYQISYQYAVSNRDNINELEPFFSPILKDYALKVITKSRLL